MRIGSTCLQQFIEANSDRIDSSMWDRICNVFSTLFAVTTPDGLFFDYRERSPESPAGVEAPSEVPDESHLVGQTPSVDSLPVLESDATPFNQPSSVSVSVPITADGNINDVAVGERLLSYVPSSGEAFARISVVTEPSLSAKLMERDAAFIPPPPVVFIGGVPNLCDRRTPEKIEFHGLIVKCVLHLLVIQTLQEVLIHVDEPSRRVRIFPTMTTLHILRLVGDLDRSYQFARAFNSDMELRVALYRMGFMKQLPNLLKQETSSVTAYVTILVNMYMDDSTERMQHRDEIEARLLP